MELDKLVIDDEVEAQKRTPQRRVSFKVPVAPLEEEVEEEDGELDKQVADEHEAVQEGVEEEDAKLDTEVADEDEAEQEDEEDEEGFLGIMCRKCTMKLSACSCPQTCTELQTCEECYDTIRIYSRRPHECASGQVTTCAAYINESHDVCCLCYGLDADLEVCSDCEDEGVDTFDAMYHDRCPVQHREMRH